MIGISACLLGHCCRYDGGCAKNVEVIKSYLTEDILPICPECAGGLPTPREPAEIIGGDGKDVLEGRAKVVTKSGIDVTAEYVNGARVILAKLKESGIDCCIMKSRSPSCGVGVIYDGSFSGKRTAGDGVASALFKMHGIEVKSADGTGR